MGRMFASGPGSRSVFTNTAALESAANRLNRCRLNQMHGAREAQICCSRIYQRISQQKPHKCRHAATADRFRALQGLLEVSRVHPSRREKTYPETNQNRRFAV